VDIGDTFIADAPGTSIDSHLWMVISYPAKSHEVVIVNFTSYREDKDQACVVEKSEHPYLKKQSIVNYPAAKLVAVKQLEALLDAGHMVDHEPLSNALLDKILDCSSDSQIDMFLWDMLNEQELIPEDI